MFLRVQLTFNLFLIFCLFKVTTPLNRRVFEGESIPHDYHTYLVKLEFHGSAPSLGECSGSFISNYWLLTSAHCIETDLLRVDVFFATKIGLRLIAQIEKRDVWPHPDYVLNKDSIANNEKDIALMYLRESINFNTYNINPIKLSTNYPEVGESGIIAGYGDAEVYSDAPREGTVVITKCPFFQSTNLICSNGRVRAGSGDSGGPLIYKGNLVGVTSAGCKDPYINRICLTVYTSVAANFDWIRKITNEIL
ncbi:unnamed protein product [Parnassius mnemosyne]|uniref:trypsin n=1 Tax=Parnassius mnemosyne TaxID=213953 RepID=A0AAV1LI56_9NEOP